MLRRGIMPKLVITPSLPDSADLAERIYKILRDDHGMGDDVDFFKPMKRDEVPKDVKKDERAPVVSDFFDDHEAQLDGGILQLEDVFKRNHLALVSHLYIPGDRFTLNDRLLQAVGFADMLKTGSIDVPHLSLVAPYTSYLRSHSIEKYIRNGFAQFNSLRFLVKVLNDAKFNNLIGIDPHSDKIDGECKVMDMTYAAINPFQSGRSLNPAKYGLTEEETIKRVFKYLRPMQTAFRDLVKASPEGTVFVGAVDDGTERRCENFVERGYKDLINPYIMLLYFLKSRGGYETSSFSLKGFSRQSIPEGSTVILIDDMFNFGGTTENTAKYLKEELGAGRVEAWVTHIVTPYSKKGIEKVLGGKYIDKVRALDTVPQDQNLLKHKAKLPFDIEYMDVSDHLLAAELYKRHQNFLSDLKKAS